MKTETKNFLEYLLEDAAADEKEMDTPPPEDESIADCTIYDFSPEFVSAVEGFIDGFISFLNKQGFNMTRLGNVSRSFGANVYCSLAGMGIGFFDEYTNDDKNLGRELQEWIRKYSGNAYRFETLSHSLSKNEKGELDLAFIPSAIDEYRNKTFNV